MAIIRIVLLVISLFELDIQVALEGVELLGRELLINDFSQELDFSFFFEKQFSEHFGMPVALLVELVALSLEAFLLDIGFIDGVGFGLLPVELEG